MKTGYCRRKTHCSKRTDWRQAIFREEYSLQLMIVTEVNHPVSKFCQRDCISRGIRVMLSSTVFLQSDCPRQPPPAPECIQLVSEHSCSIRKTYFTTSTVMTVLLPQYKLYEEKIYFQWTFKSNIFQ